MSLACGNLLIPSMHHLATLLNNVAELLDSQVIPQLSMLLPEQRCCKVPGRVLFGHFRACVTRSVTFKELCQRKPDDHLYALVLKQRYHRSHSIVHSRCADGCSPEERNRSQNIASEGKKLQPLPRYESKTPPRRANF